MIDKTSLAEYNDLCMQVVETEAQLERLIRAEKEILHDSVKGSNPEFPYEPMSFHIAGVGDKVTSEDIAKFRVILSERREAVKEKRLEVEAWINTIPVRMQRIVRMKYFENMTWQEVAMRMGNNVGGDAIRKEFHSFIEKVD